MKGFSHQSQNKTKSKKANPKGVTKRKKVTKTERSMNSKPMSEPVQASAKLTDFFLHDQPKDQPNSQPEVQPEELPQDQSLHQPSYPISVVICPPSPVVVQPASDDDFAILEALKANVGNPAAFVQSELTLKYVSARLRSVPLMQPSSAR